MNLDNEIILALILNISGIISLYLKMRSENKKANKDLTSLMLQRLSGIEDTVNRQGMDYSGFKDDAMFRMRFRNAIAERASTILISSRGTKALHEFNSVLLDWVSHIQEFGLKYWYSSYRSRHAKEDFNAQDLRDYIELDMTSFVNSFEKQLKAEITGEKVYDLNGKKIMITFADYLKTTKCYILSELLLIDLVKNGFPEAGNEYRIRFETFTADFIGQFVDAVINWREMEDYDTFLETQIDKM